METYKPIKTLEPVTGPHGALRYEGGGLWVAPLSPFGQEATIYMLGMIPSMVSAHDKRGAVEQLHENYLHGGGWSDFDGFELVQVADGWLQLQYEGDPPMLEVAQTLLVHKDLDKTTQLVAVFQSAWVVVVNDPYGEKPTWRCTRMG